MIEMKFLKLYIFIGFPLGPYSDQSVHLLFWLHHLHFGKTFLALNVGKYIKNFYCSKRYHASFLVSFYLTFTLFCSMWFSV